MSDDRVELKPCPWCSATPVVEHVNIGDCKWRCSCPNWNECEAQPETFGGTAKQATEAWNTRTLDPSIESLQAEVEQVISAWAFAHDIDGAVRNDLFKRLRQALAAKEQTR